jgi:hypothetical protein
VSDTPQTHGRTHGQPDAGPAVPACRRWRRAAAVAAFALFSLAVLDNLANRRPVLAGDIWEHWLIAESFDRHGSPELRDEDIPPVYGAAARLGQGDPPPRPHAYETAPDGRRYGVHFWAYAMCGVPAKAFLRWTGRDELAWPGLSNAVWFLLALGVVLFASAAPVRERLALAGLAAAGPGWVYVGWPGSELFSWAFLLIAVFAYRDRRYGWSGLAAGLAALQNPPSILFGGVALLAAARERRWRSAAATCLGVAVGLLPYAFFQFHFGKPNLIAKDFARLEYISWMRTWSQFADLNQGLLPFAPVLLVAFAFGAVRVALARDVRGLLLLAGAAAVAVGTQVSRNWNSSCDGLQRYLVWLIPLLAGVAVQGLGNGRVLWVLAALAVAVQGALVPVYRETGALERGYLGHTAMAEWALVHTPALYWAEHEVFVERTRRDDNWPMTPSPFPVAFVRPDGTVSKMLLDAGGVENVARVYEVDPGYLEQLRAEAAGRTDPFYAHPPRGAVRVRAAP